jgi:hypothetical protein
VAKIALFRALFRGREDVYPRRFESRKSGKAGGDRDGLCFLYRPSSPTGCDLAGAAAPAEVIVANSRPTLV